MKRIGILLLAAMFAVSLAVAEEASFMEESFCGEPFSDEQFFEEDAFFAEQDSFGGVTEELFLPPQWDEAGEEAEDRSVIALPGEWSDYIREKEDWQYAPTKVSTSLEKNSNVKISWEHKLKKLPKNVQFYVYEIDADGKAIEIGRTTKKSLKFKLASPDDHTYFVRTEKVDKANAREKYGERSELHRLSLSNEVKYYWYDYKKAPEVQIERTGATTVTLTWKPDSLANAYWVVTYHGKQMVARKQLDVGSQSIMTYTDTEAVIGKNTYEVYGSGLKKITKKTINLQEDAWKTAPVVKDVKQISESKVKISFSHVEIAKQYLVTVGKVKTTIKTAEYITDRQFFVDDPNGVYNAGDDGKGGYYVIVPVKGTGKQKVTIQPQGFNEKNKTVNGDKSNTVTLEIVKDTLLGARDVKAEANGNEVTVTWTNLNSAHIYYGVMLFSPENPDRYYRAVFDPTNCSYTFTNVVNGTYKAFVRVFTESSSTEFEPYLYDTITMELPEVVVDGLSSSEQKISILNPSGNTASIETVYLGTHPGMQLSCKYENSANHRKVIWYSTNPMVASVDGTGYVRGHKEGLTIIYAKAGTATAGCLVNVDDVKHRAVVVAQKAPHRTDNTNWDNGYRFEADLYYAKSMLEDLGYTVTTSLDESQANVKATISRAFSSADENDISLIYWAGHGNTSVSNRTSGALSFTDGTEMLASDFAEMLEDNIGGGRVVVMLGSCGSGAMIRDLEERGAAADYSQSFIDAFAALDDGLDARYYELSDTAQQSKKDYYVLTAAAKHTSSWSGYEDGSENSYNNMITYVGESAGYNRGGVYTKAKKKDDVYVQTTKRDGKTTEGTWQKKTPGDENGNGSVSFLECFHYVYHHQTETNLGAAEHDVSHMYASGPDIEIFRRNK